MTKVSAVVLAVILALSMAYVQSTQGIISISVGRTSPPCWGYFCPSPAPLLSISSAPCRPGKVHRFVADPMSTFPWWVEICTR